MICTITVLNVKTHKLESQTIKKDNINPNKDLLNINNLINDINNKSESLIVMNINVSFVSIIEEAIANSNIVNFKD